MDTQTETPPAAAPANEPVRILRTFRLCDHRGQLIASVSLDASVEIDPEPGVTAEDALRRLQAGFRLTFERIRKGKEAEGMYQSDGEPKQEKRPRRKEKSEEEEKAQQARIEEIGQEILDALPSAGEPFDRGWKSKADIQQTMEEPPSDSEWGAALRWLLESGKIEKQGQKRGSQYRKAGSS